MRITARDLKRIINEEVARSLFEGDVEGGEENITVKPLSAAESAKREAAIKAFEAELFRIFGDEKENMKIMKAALDRVVPEGGASVKESRYRRYRR